MSVLILNRWPLAAYPYDQMLAGHSGPLVMLADAERLRLNGEDPADYAHRYAPLETFENYDLNGRVELRALQLHEQYEFTQVIATWEFDMARAARLRERFGFAGQNVESATVYRDKAVMKDAARAAGIGVTPYRRIESALDVIDFVAEHGLPVVVKPRNAAASIGIRILTTQAELEALLDAGLAPSMEAIPDLMVEKFVDGLMYHVDGVVLDGKLVVLWPSLYHNDSLSYAEDRPLGSAILAPDHPLRVRLQDFARTIVTSFATPFATTFHCEVFHKADTDELLLCEIASRTGGSGCPDMLRLGFDIKMSEVWIRNLCGLPVDVPAKLSDPGVLPNEPMGWLAVPGHEGARFDYDPATVPFDWIMETRYKIAPNKVMIAAANNSEHVAYYIIRGESETQVRERLVVLQSWVYDHFLMPDGSALSGRVPAAV